MSRDFYATLGLYPDAEDVVIRAAYKALAQRYHPDRFEGPKNVANERMSEINAAYAVLSDPDKRAAYDQQRKSSNESEEIGDDESGAAFAEAPSAPLPNGSDGEKSFRPGFIVGCIVMGFAAAVLVVVLSRPQTAPTWLLFAAVAAGVVGISLAFGIVSGSKPPIVPPAPAEQPVNQRRR